MSERKVLNKYYPPDFDPSKIPKLRLPRNRQYSIRIMAPFNMKCNTCGEYIYKGKKFNSRKETVENEDYLGLKIFRFYIKCPRCVAEIAFKTDPQNTDYELEDGATRNFEPLRTAEMLAEKERKAKEDEELNNPMKVLENRTKASRQEMEMLENLEELRELNSRHAKVDHGDMLLRHAVYEEQLRCLQEEEDENFVKSLFGESGGASLKRLVDDEDEVEVKKQKTSTTGKPTDVLTQDAVKKSGDGGSSSKKPATWERSVGSLSSKSSLSGLVKKKPLAKPATKTDSEKQPSNQSKESSSLAEPVNGSLVSKTSGDNQPSTQTKDSSSPKEQEDLKGKTSQSGASTCSNLVANGPSGLGLLGSYSDSDSNDSD